LRAWTPALKDPDPARRREALEQLAALNGEHANAPLRELTEAVAAGLKDEELTVRARAAVLLSTGQDPKTARSALIRGLDPLSDVLQRRQALGLPSEEVVAYGAAVVASLGSFRDDRAVAALVSFLKKNARVVYASVMESTLDALLDYGTLDAVSAVVQYLGVLEGLGTVSHSQLVHDRLLDLARERDLSGVPDFSMKGSPEWKRWLEKNRRAFPTKLSG
jgi:hypothetical protein